MIYCKKVIISNYTLTDNIISELVEAQTISHEMTHYYYKIEDCTHTEAVFCYGEDVFVKQGLSYQRGTEPDG